MAFKIVSQTVTEVEDRDPNLYVKRAEDFLRRKQFSSALQEMDKAIDYAGYKQKNRYIFEKVKIYGAIGKDPGAAGFIKKHLNALYSYLSLDEFYRVLAVLQNNSSDLAGTLSACHIPAILADLYRSNCISREDFLNRAQRFKNSGDYAKALQCISVVEDMYGENVDSSLLKARIIKAKGSYRDALAYYVRASHLSGAPVEVYLEIVGLHLQLNQRPDAKRWIETGLKKFPEHLDLLHQKADLLYKDKSYEECLETVNLLLAKDAANARALYLKGLIYDDQSQFFLANWYLKKANRLNGKLHIPANPDREKFIWWLKASISAIVITVILLAAGRFMLYLTGIKEPTVENVSLSVSEEIFVGETIDVYKDFTYTPSYAKEPDIEIKVADPEIAKLDSERGLLEGVKAGTTRVSMIWDGEVLVSRKVEVVEPGIADFTIQLSKTRMNVGDEARISAEVTMDFEKADAPEVTYESSNPDVAAVSDSGEITALDVGESIITARTDGMTKSATVYVDALVKDITLKESEILLGLGETHTLIPTVVTFPPGHEVKGITFSSEDTAIASIDPDGKITALSYGETQVSAESENGIKQTIPVKIYPKKVSGLDAEYTEESRSIMLTWDEEPEPGEIIGDGAGTAGTDDSGEGDSESEDTESDTDSYGNGESGGYGYENDPEQVKYEVEVSMDHEVEKKTVSTGELELTNVKTGSTYTFSVVAIYKDYRSDPAKVTVIVPKTEEELRVEKEAKEEEALNQRKVAAMNKLVGYWKRSDKDYSPYDDKYLFIYGDISYWRMDFQSDGSNYGSEKDTSLYNISFEGNQIKANSVIFVFQSNNEITVKYSRWDNYGMVLDKDGYVTQHYKRITKNQVEKKYIDRYPGTQLP